MRPRILVDCDGVLADFVGAVLEWDGHAHTRESITQPDIMAAWGTPERWPELNALCQSAGWCASLKPIEGAREFVDWLRSWADVFVVTSPYADAPTWCHERIQWLAAHFGIDRDRVVFARDKSVVRGGGDVLIDDFTKNLEAFGGEGILIRQPWNADARGMDFAEARSLLSKWFAAKVPRTDATLGGANQ